MDFASYLVEKKIDEKAFKVGDPATWEHFMSIFAQMHPNSFTAQKLFLINGIRRKYPLKIEESESLQTKAKASKSKPVMKPGKPKVVTGKPKMAGKPKVPVKPKISSGKPNVSSNKPKPIIKRPKLK